VPIRFRAQPRALAAAQVRTVKNVVDRIKTFHELKGRRHRGASTGAQDSTDG
jgi:hypothetical protein